MNQTSAQKRWAVAEKAAAQTGYRSPNFTGFEPMAQAVVHEALAGDGCGMKIPEHKPS